MNGCHHCQHGCGEVFVGLWGSDVLLPKADYCICLRGVGAGGD